MKVFSGIAAALLLTVLPAASGSAQIPLQGPKCFGTEATIVGTDGDDVLTGTPDADVVVGLDGDDTIRGLAGGDALCGGNGADVIVGGPGFDGVAVGRGADEGYGGAGIDLVLEFSSDSCSPCMPFDPRSRDNAADVLSGGPAMDWLAGEGGDDRIVGGPGSDLVLHLSRFTSVSIDLSLGRAVSSAGGVDELVGIENAFGSVNSDTIRGDNGPNSLFGFWGQDVIDGAAGGDWITAGYSGSVLNGGEDESADTLGVFSNVPAHVDLAAGFAMAREDVSFYSPDVVARFENVMGSADDDVLAGSLDANRLEGGYGHDEVSGAGGNDVLFGDYAVERMWLGTPMPGNDVIDGG
ncbi:MAG: hypothetical protein M3279_06270, partial [Actinomycetota bacterium]|nr:hypothetical protein [Actinomycetota bacterium]